MFNQGNCSAAFIVSNLDTSKAHGPDCPNPRLLREAVPILKYPLCKLFKISLSLSSFPSEWKLTNVTPVFKNDSPGILKNYRQLGREVCGHYRPVLIVHRRTC
jgi:hypothetical protein